MGCHIEQPDGGGGVRYIVPLDNDRVTPNRKRVEEWSNPIVQVYEEEYFTSPWDQLAGSGRIIQCLPNKPKYLHFLYRLVVFRLRRLRFDFLLRDILFCAMIFLWNVFVDFDARSW